MSGGGSDAGDVAAARSFGRQASLDLHLVAMIMDFVKPPTYQKFIHKFSTRYANIFVPVGKGKNHAFVVYLSCICR
jgi:hypothetical protein